MGGGRGRPRPPAACDHRSFRGRAAADGHGRRALRRQLQWRGLQLPRTAHRVAGAGAPLPHPHRHRGGAGGLRRMGPRRPAPLQRHVRPRPLRPRRAAAHPRARPFRDQAALLDGRGRARAVRLGGEGDPRRSRRLRRARRGGAGRVPDLPELLHRPHAVPRHPPAAAGGRAHPDARTAGRAHDLVGLRLPRGRGGRRRRARRGVRPAVPPGGEPAARRRRARGRLSLGRDRLGRDHRRRRAADPRCAASPWAST